MREVRAKSKNEFGEDAIRICVNAMFDSGKPYDNSDEVIKQLKIEVLTNIRLHFCLVLGIIPVPRILEARRCDYEGQYWYFSK